MIITKVEAKARGMTEDKTCDFHGLYPDQSALKFCQDCIIIRDPCGCDMDMSCEECDPIDTCLMTKWEWIASEVPY